LGYKKRWKQDEHVALIVPTTIIPHHALQQDQSGNVLPHSTQQPDLPATDSFLADVLDGLGKDQKELQCKYFYDEQGSLLFDQICELPEYYLTRTEQSIMDEHVSEMADQLGSGVMLVEFGSGSSTKTTALLDQLDSPAAYVPLDISEEHLLKTAETLRQRYPQIEILPLVADFTRRFELPQSKIRPTHAAVYFPGSTIGNFTPAAAGQMLQTIANILAENGGLLIGIDLQKETAIIEAAYNDAQRVTDAFNLNVLHRVNRELGADFEVEHFSHEANYNEALGRVEIYVVSDREQRVTIAGHEFRFGQGERTLTEYSHKYTIEGFSQLAADAGFTLRKYWTDERKYFAVLHLVNDPA
jgi:dimethylhistidine N-methyltransferase